jgi:hypothetical protein
MRCSGTEMAAGRAYTGTRLETDWRFLRLSQFWFRYIVYPQSSWILQIVGSDLTFKLIRIPGFVAGHRIFGMRACGIPLHCIYNAFAMQQEA